MTTPQNPDHIAWDSNPLIEPERRLPLTGSIGRFYIDIEFNEARNGWVCIFDDLPLPCVASRRSLAALWVSRAAPHFLRGYPGWDAWSIRNSSDPASSVSFAHNSEAFLNWMDGLNDALVGAGLARRRQGGAERT